MRPSYKTKGLSLEKYQKRSKIQKIKEKYTVQNKRIYKIRDDSVITGDIGSQYEY